MDDNEEESVVATSCALIICYRCNFTSQQSSSFGVMGEEVFATEGKTLLSQYTATWLRQSDKIKFTNFVRIDWSKFNELLSPFIFKNHSSSRTERSFGQLILFHYGRPLSVAWAKSIMLCFANVIFLFFLMAALCSGRPRLTEVRETFTRSGLGCE